MENKKDIYAVKFSVFDGKSELRESILDDLYESREDARAKIKALGTACVSSKVGDYRRERVALDDVDTTYIYIGRSKKPYREYRYEVIRFNLVVKQG